MKQTITLTLLIVACLTVVPSIAQGRYRDGMNLYQYVRSAPTNYVDWNGAAAQNTSAQASQATPRIRQPSQPPEPKLLPTNTQLVRMPNDAKRRQAIRKHRKARIDYMIDKLVKVCRQKGAVKNANGPLTQSADCCTKPICEKEAEAIAEAYNAMWEKYAYHPKSFGLTPPPPLMQDGGEINAGWRCDHWAQFTWETVQGLKKKRENGKKKLKCWKFARAGNVHWEDLDKHRKRKKGDRDYSEGWSKYAAEHPEYKHSFGTNHNWVTATVGRKAVADSKYTVRLDPWTAGPRNFIWTQKEHGWKSGYIATGNGKTRGDGMINVLSIDPPSKQHDGPPGSPDPDGRPYNIRPNANDWPGGTATVGLEK